MAYFLRHKLYIAQSLYLILCLFIFLTQLNCILSHYTICVIWKLIFLSCGPGSSVGIATDYGLDGPGIESRWGEIFRRPYRPWGPPSLLYNGCRVFPEGKKRTGRDTDPSPHYSAEVQKQSRAIPLLSLRAFVAYKKGETYLSSFYWHMTFLGL